MIEKGPESPASGDLLAAGTRFPRLDDHEAAQVQMRSAIDWLARVAHSYAVGPKAGLSLRLDQDARRLYTPDLAPGTRLGLHLPTLVFQFEEQGAPTPHALDVDDRSSTEVEAWLLAELLHRGFDRSHFKKELPYGSDGRMAGDEMKYGPHRLSDELHRLTQAIVEAATDLRMAKATPSGDLLFWPDRCAIGFADGGSEVVVRAIWSLGRT